MTRKELSMMLEKASFSPGDIPRFFDLLLESRKEAEITRREGKKYAAVRDVMIQEISGRYGFYRYCFSQIFAERRGVILKDFEVIDKGMRENNRELIQRTADYADDQQKYQRKSVSNPATIRPLRETW